MNCVYRKYIYRADETVTSVTKALQSLAVTGFFEVTVRKNTVTALSLLSLKKTAREEVKRMKKVATPEECLALFDAMSEEDRDMLEGWIRHSLRYRITPLKSITSVGLKNMLIGDLRFHCTNDQFKGAMWDSGHFPVNEEEENWIFCLSKRSRAFRPHRQPVVLP